MASWSTVTMIANEFDKLTVTTEIVDEGISIVLMVESEPRTRVELILDEESADSLLHRISSHLQDAGVAK